MRASLLRLLQWEFGKREQLLSPRGIAIRAYH
jgi:hypothetical protein